MNVKSDNESQILGLLVLIVGTNEYYFIMEP